MQCSSCGSKWESKNIVTTCPFCGANFEKKNPEDMGVSDAIESIIATQGLDILKNSRLVNAYIMDMVRWHDREKKLFKIMCVNGVLETACKIAGTSESEVKTALIKKQLKSLVEDAFLAENNAIDALNIVLRGIGEKEIEKHLPESQSKIETPILHKNKTVSSPVTKEPEKTGIVKDNIQKVVFVDVNTDEKQYLSACRVKDDGLATCDISKLDYAITLFSLVDTYKDSTKLIEQCQNEILRIKYESALNEKKKVFSYKDADVIERTINQAISTFESIADYEDSRKQIEECKQIKLEKIYEIAVDTMKIADKYIDETIYSKAIMILGKIRGYKDADELSEYCSKQLEVTHKEAVYKKAYYYYQKDDAFSLETAIENFEKILDYKDSRQLISECRSRLVKAKEQKEKQSAFNDQQYSKAIALLNKKDIASIRDAVQILDTIPTWKDSRVLSERYRGFLSSHNKALEDIANQWKKQGLCQYCGGAFKGLFSKKCSKCGKAKDY